MTANQQRQAHWTKVRQAKADVEQLVWAVVKQSKIQPVDGLVSIRLVWFAPDARERDSDGLYPMMKAVVDGLVKSNILKGDSNKHVYDTRCGPIVVARDNPRMEVWIRRIVEAGGGLPHH